MNSNTAKRTVQLTKTAITWAFLFAVPFALMAQPSPPFPQPQV